MPQEFPLGQIVITSNALRTLHEPDVLKALTRHALNDWGDVDDEDKRTNDESLRKGYRILSSYRDSKNVKFWIITEADRSVTTILLPEDY
jgi:hypothetical protein